MRGSSRRIAPRVRYVAVRRDERIHVSVRALSVKFRRGPAGSLAWGARAPLIAHVAIGACAD